MDKICILLAIYNPNVSWLKELLFSIDNQDYSNYCVNVIDDCSNKISFKELSDIFAANLLHTEYKLSRNKENLGSNKTFELLVKESSCKYIAFCDQDDIWHKDKLSISLNTLVALKKQMVCSDVNVISELGRKLYDSVEKYNKNIKISIKSNLKKYLLFHNFVIGCTILAEREFVLSCIPFFNSMYHDHQMAISASITDNLYIIDKPLVDYRVHDKNQTSTLKEINTPEEYYQKHILRDFDRYIMLKKKYDYFELEQAYSFTLERIKNYQHQKNKISKYKNLDYKTYLFERYILKCRLLFKLFIKLNKV